MNIFKAGKKELSEKTKKLLEECSIEARCFLTTIANIHHLLQNKYYNLSKIELRDIVINLALIIIYQKNGGKGKFFHMTKADEISNNLMKKDIIQDYLNFLKIDIDEFLFKLEENYRTDESILKILEEAVYEDFIFGEYLSYESYYHVNIKSLIKNTYYEDFPFQYDKTKMIKRIDQKLDDCDIKKKLQKQDETVQIYLDIEAKVWTQYRYHLRTLDFSQENWGNPLSLLIAIFAIPKEYQTEEIKSLMKCVYPVTPTEIINYCTWGTNRITEYYDDFNEQYKKRINDTYHKYINESSIISITDIFYRILFQEKTNNDLKCVFDSHKEEGTTYDTFLKKIESCIIENHFLPKCLSKNLDLIYTESLPSLLEREKEKLKRTKKKEMDVKNLESILPLDDDILRGADIIHKLFIKISEEIEQDESCKKIKSIIDMLSTSTLEKKKSKILKVNQEEPNFNLEQLENLQKEVDDVLPKIKKIVLDIEALLSYIKLYLSISSTTLDRIQKEKGKIESNTTKLEIINEDYFKNQNNIRAGKILSQKESSIYIGKYSVERELISLEVSLDSLLDTLDTLERIRYHLLPLTMINPHFQKEISEITMADFNKLNKALQQMIPNEEENPNTLLEKKPKMKRLMDS